MSDEQKGRYRAGDDSPECVDLRNAFVQRLTVDSPSQDRRRRDFNQAIFLPESEGGFAVWSRTDLEMVLECFDAALRDVYRARTEASLPSGGSS